MSESEYNEPIIKVENLCFSYEDNPVLIGINLEIYSREKIFLVGSNGCGKTTLAKHFVGLRQPDEGRVLFYRKDLATLSEQEMNNIRRKIGFVFQHDALFSEISVNGNLIAGERGAREKDPFSEEYRDDEKDLERRVISCLKEVGLDYREVKTKMPSELSGGQQKKVAVARAMLSNPDIFIYDEPTCELDPESEKSVCDLISQLYEKGKTTILITNYKETLEIMGEMGGNNGRVIMLKQGKVYQSLPYNDFMVSEDKEIKKYLGKLYTRKTKIAG